MSLDSVVASVEGWFSSAGKIVMASVAIISVVTSCAYGLTEFLPLPKKLSALESKVAEQEELLRYLVCSDITTARGGTVEGCIFIIRDSEYYGDFQTEGVVP